MDSHIKPDSGLLDPDCDEPWCEDGSFCDVSKEEQDKLSDLDREWNRRHNQFYTIGYRDGLMAGKEASAQEGFNVGFKQSVLVGYSWGIVRGVTSAMACLPDGLKEKLVQTLEKREKIQTLYESVHSLSTRDALNMFHDDFLTSNSEEHGKNLGGHAHSVSMSNDISCYSQLGSHFTDLESFLLESPAIKVHLALDQKMVG